MNDSQWTRFVGLRAGAHRPRSRNKPTSFDGRQERVELTNHQALFNMHQRLLVHGLRGLTRSGVAVFALQPRIGITGHLWLAATEQLRTGTIGRHGSVDLFLDGDQELSLRHLLVLVKRSASGELCLGVADLATPAGFQAEEGGLLHAVEANSALVLRAASYSLFFFPTGGPLPWDPGAADPWSTLPRRVRVTGARLPNALRVRRERRSRDTYVRCRGGPSEPGPEPLLQPHERVEGHVVITKGASEECLAAGARALERGIILGRYARCAGGTTEISQDVSRVHAVLLRFEGEVHLIDAGSKNGTFKGDQRVKCAPVEVGCPYRLGKRTHVRWEPVY
jgi:hypothetical protein